MNHPPLKHLCSEQIAECVLGLPDPVARRHLEDCAACRAELAKVREALGEFRGAVRGWSENQARELSISARPSESRSWIAAHQLALALLLAAVCIVASIAVPWYERDRSGAVNDAALLNQVDSEVSRTAPSSMEPLMKLVVETGADVGKQE